MNLNSNECTQDVDTECSENNTKSYASIVFQYFISISWIKNSKFYHVHSVPGYMLQELFRTPAVTTHYHNIMCMPSISGIDIM